LVDVLFQGKKGLQMTYTLDDIRRLVPEYPQCLHDANVVGGNMLCAVELLLSTRAKLEIAVEALNVVKDCSDNLSHAMKKSGLKDCIDAYCIATEALAKIKELS